MELLLATISERGREWGALQLEGRYKAVVNAVFCDSLLVCALCNDGS